MKIYNYISMLARFMTLYDRLDSDEDTDFILNDLHKLVVNIDEFEIDEEIKKYIKVEYDRMNESIQNHEDNTASYVDVRYMDVYFHKVSKYIESFIDNKNNQLIITLKEAIEAERIYKQKKLELEEYKANLWLYTNFEEKLDKKRATEKDKDAYIRLDDTYKQLQDDAIELQCSYKMSNKLLEIKLLQLKQEVGEK